MLHCGRLAILLLVIGLRFRGGGAIADDAPPMSAPMSMDVATALSGLTPQEFTDMVQRVRESVVVVTFSGRDKRELGLGSGFVIDAKGLIATNLHVIGEARPISVMLHDKRSFPVQEILAVDKTQDLAILKVEADGLTPLPLAEEANVLKQGQPVFALGNPQGLEHSVVTGVVSGFREEDDGMSLIQLAIPIEKGNSGGPLLDMQGNVHGLLTLKSQVTENLGYAVKSSFLKPLLEEPHPIPMSRWLTIGRLNRRYWTYEDDVHWSQRAGRIRVDGMGAGFGGRALCLWNEAPPQVPYEVAVTVKVGEPDGAAGLVFHAAGELHYGFYPSSGKLRFTRFDGPTVYDWHVLKETHSRHLDMEDWNRLKVRVEADRFQCYCNDELVFEIVDDEYVSGKVGLAKFRHTTADFKQFQVAGQIPSLKSTDELRERIVTATQGLPLDQPMSARYGEPLGQLDEQGIAALSDYAESLELRAQRIRELSTAIRQQQLRDQLVKVLNPSQEGEAIDLARGALLLAAIDNPEVDIEFSLRELDHLAEDFLESLPGEVTPEEKLLAFHKFLFDEQGFHGSRTNYYHASNSFLNEVIDDREGLPITLSVLYLEVARRAGIRAEGIGLPGHFIVKTHITDGDSRFVDVFDGGIFLTEKDCRNMVREMRGLAWDDAYLAPQSAQEIIIRMLRNLIGIANSEQDAESALRYTETVLAVDPDSVQDHLFKAVVCYSSGRIQEGLAEIDWIMDHEPEGIDLSRLLQLRKAFEELQMP